MLCFSFRTNVSPMIVHLSFLLVCRKYVKLLLTQKLYKRACTSVSIRFSNPRHCWRLLYLNWERIFYGWISDVEWLNHSCPTFTKVPTNYSSFVMVLTILTDPFLWPTLHRKTRPTEDCFCGRSKYKCNYFLAAHLWWQRTHHWRGDICPGISLNRKLSPLQVSNTAFGRRNVIRERKRLEAIHDVLLLHCS